MHRVRAVYSGFERRSPQVDSFPANRADPEIPIRLCLDQYHHAFGLTESTNRCRILVGEVRFSEGEVQSSFL